MMSHSIDRAMSDISDINQSGWLSISFTMGDVTAHAIAVSSSCYDTFISLFDLQCSLTQVRSSRSSRDSFRS